MSNLYPLEIDDSYPICMPPRSRLYSIEPCGLGTSAVESLTSYLVRLAQAHSVTINTLITRELAFPFTGEIPMVSNKWHFDNLLFNGHLLSGIYKNTRLYVDSLRMLTCQKNLEYLTMMPWADVFSSYRLVRQTRFWCPVCYEEWRENETPIYDQLIWSIDFIVFCSQHRVLLLSNCRKCCRLQPLLSHNVQLGTCSFCGEWLGSTSKVTDRKDRVYLGIWKSWLTYMIESMISDIYTYKISPNRLSIVEYLLRLLEIKNINMLSRVIPDIKTPEKIWAANKELKRVLRGDGKIRLDSFLKLCFCFQTNPMSIFLDEKYIIRYKDAVSENFPVDQKVTNKPSNEIIRDALYSAIHNTNFPSPSLKSVARGLNISVVMCKWKFPNECIMIVDNYHNRYKHEYVRQLLLSVVEGKISFSRVLAILRSTEDTMRKYHPDICAKIPKPRLRGIDKDRVRNILKEALTQNPPPFRDNIIRITGYHVSYLQKFFSDELKQISIRYKAYRAQVKQKNTDVLIKNIRQIIYELHSDGQYPSKRKIIAKIGKPGTFFLNRLVQDAWKNALKELGYAVSSQLPEK